MKNHKEHDEANVDPVCGMTVTKEEAACSYDYNGKTFYFCALSCRDQFCLCSSRLAVDLVHYVRHRENAGGEQDGPDDAGEDSDSDRDNHHHAGDDEVSLEPAGHRLK
jgi:YHS domain-containing protein